MTNRTIAFLSDVGSRDDAAAICKGLITSICPDSSIIDISHDVQPFDVAEGAHYLKEIPHWFPEGTTICAYVYPETGSGTPTIAIRNEKKQIIVVPDNGLATYALETVPAVVAHEVTAPGVMAQPSTPTWFGRDVVVAAAAHLAAGYPLEDVGPERDLAGLTRLDVPTVTVADGVATGEIIRIDSAYGNVWTNITLDVFGSVAAPAVISVRIDGQEHSLPLCRTFADVATHQPLAYVSSRSQLAFGLNRSNFAELHKIERGMPVQARVIGA